MHARGISAGLFAWILLGTAALFQADQSTHAENTRKSSLLSPADRLRPLAEAGDPDAQNMMGYLLFHGEGVERDLEAAHAWFHRAADQGHKIAQRKLGIYHSGLFDHAKDQVDADEANLWLVISALYHPAVAMSEQDAHELEAFFAAFSGDAGVAPRGIADGRRLFVQRCSGCHGFSGTGAYPGVPDLAGPAIAEARRAPERVRLILTEGLASFDGHPVLAVAEADRIIPFLVELRGERAPTVDPMAQMPVRKPERGDMLAQGEEVFLTFCGGCHGFGGIAFYVNSPSFSLRERMSKSDDELIRSIKQGRGLMPSWENKLSESEIQSLVVFIRELSERYDGRIESPRGMDREPDLYFRFRPAGERGPEWGGADPIMR